MNTGTKIKKYLLALCKLFRYGIHILFASDNGIKTGLAVLYGIVYTLAYFSGCFVYSQDLGGVILDKSNIGTYNLKLLFYLFRYYRKAVSYLSAAQAVAVRIGIDDIYRIRQDNHVFLGGLKEGLHIVFNSIYRLRQYLLTGYGKIRCLNVIKINAPLL